MYSKYAKSQIRNYERSSFRELKEKENKDRIIPISEDILYTSDFTLEKFSSSGDSGELFLATNKKNHDERYIIKHEYYDCACNEYMYSKIGNKMGIKIAPVKLFVVNDKEKKFKSDFVCGIKYLEDCQHVNFKDIEDNKDNISNWKDYFRMFSLEFLFEESDGIEIVKYKNELYRLDTTAAFTISNFSIYPLAYEYDNNGINIREFANKNILKRADRNTKNRISRWESDITFFMKKFGKEFLNYYLETFSLLKNVTEEDIEEWTNILTYFYPNIIGEYFKSYFNNLKLDVDEFLIEIHNKDLINV